MRSWDELRSIKTWLVALAIGNTRVPKWSQNENFTSIRSAKWESSFTQPECCHTFLASFPTLFWIFIFPLSLKLLKSANLIPFEECQSDSFQQSRWVFKVNRRSKNVSKLFCMPTFKLMLLGSVFGSLLSSVVLKSLEGSESRISAIDRDSEPKN